MSARFTNPIARDGDFADPFVLRFNGRYYLYCTNPDLRCWSSSDLVSWKLEGPTISEDLFPGLVPFAPEVVYSNGWFYLYTSPSGTGHRVLRSESPTGPFELISDNVGHEIDGNILVDDDGRWYFYWAGDEGIWGCEMPTPTTFGEPVLTGAQMNGWTEGPFVVKRDGRYQMTLTGNHYLNPAYRINAAVSDDPLHGYVDDPLNPVLLNVVGDGIGLGHSSSVVGPDLVSTWMAYHNLNPDETRDLNLAQQVWNGGALQVLGPVSSAEVPRMPDVVGRDGDWTPLGVGESAVCTERTGAGDVTAEVTIAGTDGGGYGVLIGDSRLVFDPLANRLSFGDTTVRLPDGYEHSAAHTITLVRTADVLEVLIDGRQQLRAVAPAGALLLGAFSEAHGARIGFCAFTNTTAEAADRAADRPVPGRFWAVLAEGVPVVPGSSGGVPFGVLELDTDAVASYRCDVASAGEYLLFLTGEFAAGDAVGVRVGDGDEAVVQAAEATRVLAHGIHTAAGLSTLRMRGLTGRPRVALVSVLADLGVPPATDRMGPMRIEGFGKRILAPGQWHDFELDAELVLRSDAVGFHGDVIFRASQLCEGGSTGTDTVLGIDFLLGYSVQIREGSVVLARHDYDTKVLAEAGLPIDLAGPVSVRIRMVGALIEVEAAGVALRFEDPLPHLTGGLGVRVAHGALEPTAFSARAGVPVVRR